MLWLGIALMCGAADPAAGSRAGSDRLKVEPLVATLDNGLRVIIERHDRTDEMAVYLHVGVGSRDEREGERGMAHLFEHLMFEGSEHAAGNAYDELVTAAGGDNNASTSEDETDYQVTLPSGALELSLFLESDRLGYLPAGLTQAALDNQKDVVLEERSRDYSTGHGRDTDALTHLLFVKGHPYHIPAFGTVSDVRGFTLDGIRAFHERWYQPSNVILSIVGNVEPDHVLKRVEHWFSDVPSSAVPTRARPGQAPALQEDVFALLEDEVGSCTLYRTWETPPTGSSDDAALLVAATVLSDGRGTRFDRHYYAKDWVLESDVDLWPTDFAGMFVASMTVEGRSLKSVDRLISREVAGLVRTPPSDAEMQRAKSRIRSWAQSALDGPSARAETLANCLASSGNPDCVSEEWRAVEAVTAGDVSAAMGRVLAGPSVRLSVVPTMETDCALPGSAAVEVP